MSAKRSNSFYIGFLLVIDVFTDYIWTIPLKSKATENVLAAFRHIITSSKRKPVLLVTDAGGYTNLNGLFSPNHFKSRIITVSRRFMLL